jgi:surface antigen
VSVLDWDVFVDEVSWFLSPGDIPEVGAEQPWRRGRAAELPELSRLLGAATVTPVSIGEQSYELLAWGAPGNRRGWLALPPSGSMPVDVHETHRQLWAVSGGVLERFGEPLTWWNNQNEVLTASAAQVSVAQVLEDYAWLWDDEGLEVPIRPSDFYAVAVEANGNLTIVHRASGQLLLFAPDHAFEGVTALAGSPPYSLLTIDDVPDIDTWIEATARAWQRP